ncbi:unnamed protein product [Calicophoron daubneyi]|uniref:Uncharacterized protein n=1 Tax=Calicophoron daubneyi TaxID=300641 RepID=A0AAV2TUF8_CALDB
MLVIGLILSCGVGVGDPCVELIFGDSVNRFVGQYSPNFKASDVQPQINWFAGIGAIFLVGAFIQTSLIGIQSKRQLRRIRILYFKNSILGHILTNPYRSVVLPRMFMEVEVCSRAILRQDVAWHDIQSAGSLISKLSENCNHIEVGIGTKLSEFVQYISSFICGIIMAFCYGWKLTLVACAMLPVIAVVFFLFGYFMLHFTRKELQAYSKASAIAGEVLAAIKTVVAFGGEEKEVQRYSSELVHAEKVGIKKSTAIGGVAGAIGLTIFSAAALIFWYGVKLMKDDGYDAGSVEIIFINVVMGSIFLGNALPNFQYFTNARTSARIIFGTIERVPPIDKDVPGVLLDNFQGNIVLKNIKFIYPTRPDTTIIQNFNLDLHSGETVAFVGPSGSGKSTIVHLLQRFYDPVEGKITIEGVDIKELDVKGLRAQIGVVQQEPSLFKGTVGENIRLGKPDATQEEIEEAAKEANAHDFICALPEGYDTMIAERGGGMSGGQKQRIAIARALIRKPKLLLLDEATSALDTRSERVVQEALEKASAGRTVVMVAHRLTTVRNADKIIVLEQGVVRETGTHEELIAANGLYAAMLQNQKQSSGQEDEDEDSDQGTYEDLEDEKRKKKKVKEKVEGVWQTTETGSEDEKSQTLVSQTISRISQAVHRKMKRLEPVKRMLRINRPEAGYIAGGCICCIIAGAAQPSFAVLVSEICDIFQKFYEGRNVMPRIRLISGMMVLVGFIRFVSMLLQGYFFGVSGERLTKRVRTMYYSSMLHQEMGWFDRPENQAGALTAKLATEASRLKSISGSELGVIMECVVLIVAALIIAFIYSWQCTLVFLCFFPLVVVAGMFQIRSMTSGGDPKADARMMVIAQEAISQARTVFTLNLEEHFSRRFKAEMDRELKKNIKAAFLFAFVYALSNSIGMFAFAAVFAVGARLIEDRTISVLALFRVLNMSAQSLGRTASFTPEAKQAAKCSVSILGTIDRRPKILINEGLVPNKPFTGKVTLKRVYFRYPTRKELRTVKNFSHTVEAGQTVALVGPSGCGKSTLIQLVQRFYDVSNHGPDSGVYFDEYNLRDLDPSWIRRQIGIVSQEPNLFDLSLRENIAYGDNTRDVSMEEITEAAKEANIHDFIVGLPEGYETIAGPGGSHLSGGQKQRIAIARALLRKPLLLLLDEATSALDNESERVVQEALDAVVGSRTSLVIAHRLSTVESADLIVVIDGGRKIEYGPPAALLQAKGAFYRLHHAEGTGAH